MWMTRVSIQNPVFATMVMVALCVLGLFSYSKLGVEQMPDISLPGAWIDVRSAKGITPLIQAAVSLSLRTQPACTAHSKPPE